MYLDFDEFGQGAPLLLLHGLFAAKRNLRSLGQHLSLQRHVSLLTARNHRYSGQAAEINYPVMAQDVLDFMDKKIIERSDMVGHSMGGKSCIYMAFHFPKRVRCACILDSASHGPKHDYTPFLLAMKNAQSIEFSTRKDMTDWLEEKVMDLNLTQFLLMNYDFSKRRWLINIDALLKNHEEITHFPELTGERSEVPILIIKAENSNYLDQNSLASMQQHFVDVQLIEIPNTSHWLHVEQPKLISEHILKFISNPDAFKA